MEPNATELKSAKYVLVPFILTSIVITTLVGTSVYAYTKNKNSKQQADLQSQIASLQLQVSLAKSMKPTADHNSSPTTSVATQPTTTSTNASSALMVANVFMGYMTDINRKSISVEDLESDRSKVLESFTPAQTSSDKSYFAFLSGTDDGQPPTTGSIKYTHARILGATNGFSGTITQFDLGADSENNNILTFPVNETIKTWDGSTYVTSVSTKYIDLIQENNSWVIANYYLANFSNVSPNHPTNETIKYSGF